MPATKSLAGRAVHDVVRHAFADFHALLRRVAFSLPSHETWSVVTIGFECIVSAAPQREVLRAVGAALSPRFHVGKLQASRFVATVPIRADERATTLIPLPHLAADGRRDPPDARGDAESAGTGRRRDRSLLLEDLGQQRVECSLDDDGGVTVANLMGQQVL